MSAASKRYSARDLLGVFGKHELESAAAKMLNGDARSLTADERRVLVEYGWASDKRGVLQPRASFLHRARLHLRVFR